MKNYSVWLSLAAAVISPTNSLAGIPGGDAKPCQCIQESAAGLGIRGVVFLAVEQEDGTFLKAATFRYYDLVGYKEAFEDCKDKMRATPACQTS